MKLLGCIALASAALLGTRAVEAGAVRPLQHPAGHGAGRVGVAGDQQERRRGQLDLRGELLV